LLVAFATLQLLQYSECAAVSSGATERMQLMESIGLKSVQEDVEKKVWEAQQASQNVDAEDDELASLMAELDGMDKEKEAAEAAAKQKDIEAKQVQSAQLKAVAAQKAADAEAAVKRKAKEVAAVAAAAQKEAEEMIASTQALRAKAASTMEEAKLASAEYQSALASGQTEGLGSLEQTAKTTLKQAEDMSVEAGEKSQAAKAALEDASAIKVKADKAASMEKESVNQLESDRLTWAAGPIFDKMKRLCEIDYAAFKKEYYVLRDSPTYAKYRWDIKKACHKAHDEDLEKKQGKEQKEDDSSIRANVDPNKPYPQKNAHWSLPKDKKVKKWCSTKFGAVPCSMLKKAQEAGLLADSETSMDTESFLQDDTGIASLDNSPDLVDMISFGDE